MCDSLSQSRWAAGNFHWVPDSPVSTKTCVVLSPPVRQLTHVGDRLLRSMLLSQVHLVLLCCSFLVTSRLIPQALLISRTPSHTLCSSHSIPWKASSSPPACPPATFCSLDLPNSGQPFQSSQLTRSFTFSRQSYSNSTCNCYHTRFRPRLSSPR